MLAAAFLPAGCAKVPVHSAPLVTTESYLVRPPLTTSLFPSDQAVLSEEAINRILSSKVELPGSAKLALMRFPEPGVSRAYGHYYWDDETRLQLQQGYVEALSAALLTSEQILEVTPLPGLMTPSDASIPILREAAVRMQADLLLVFSVSTDTYSKYRTFAKDRVKSYSTCELVLLDVRTGLVPFTKVATRERQEDKLKDDLDLAETMRRAEKLAAADALNAAANKLVDYIKLMPRRQD